MGADPVPWTDASSRLHMLTIVVGTTGRKGSLEAMVFPLFVLSENKNSIRFFTIAYLQVSILATAPFASSSDDCLQAISQAILHLEVFPLYRVEQDRTF
jgi:hypothetical protein